MTYHLAEARAYARELAEDGILNDPDDDTIIGAVMDYTTFHGYSGDEIVSILDAYNDGAGSYL